LTSVSSELVLSTTISHSNLQNTLQSNVQLGHPIGSIKCQKSSSSGDLLKDGTTPSSEMNEGNIAHVAERFKKIYEQSEWGEDGQGSGMGSSLEQTNTLRVILEMVIYRFAATSFLDAPCGSAYWWKELLPRIRENIPCFRYYGVDVAPLAIERAKVSHAGDTFTTFTLGDVSRVPLPVGVDLALCRDALQHLPMSEAVRLLRNLAAARPKHVLLGSYSSERANVKINVGE
jgi:SAM-dependent methyltransferase